MRGRWQGRRGRVLGAVVALAVLTGLSGCATPRWQSELVSVNAAGTDSGDGASWNPRFAPDGTRVVFESRATNLGPTDTNGQGDVYVRELTSGETELVSANAAGTDGGNGESRFPWLSPDGTKALFTSTATNLASPATGGRQSDLYLRDLVTGTTTLVSVNAEGTGGGDATTSTGSVSPEGDKVVFASDARNLVVPDTNSLRDVYVRDETARTYRLVSTNAAGDGAGNGESGEYALVPSLSFYVKELSVSSDGSLVAFGSQASNLGPTDSSRPDNHDVYIAELVTPPA